MKYIITEQQLNQLKKKPIEIPFTAFSNDWDALQTFLNKRKNPPYILVGDLNLNDRNDIDSLGSLVKVLGDVNLSYSSISSLGDLTTVSGYLDITRTPIKNLGNLSYVGKDLSAGRSSLSSLGKLEYVGDDLYLKNTPFSKTSNINTKQDILNKVFVVGKIYLDI